MCIRDSSNEERRIYDLVVRRFLAVLLPPCVYEETVIRASIEKECFTARGKRMVEKGWQEAYEDNRYDDADEAKMCIRDRFWCNCSVPSRYDRCS